MRGMIDVNHVQTSASLFPLFLDMLRFRLHSIFAPSPISFTLRKIKFTSSSLWAAGERGWTRGELATRFTLNAHDAGVREIQGR